MTEPPAAADPISRLNAALRDRYHIGRQLGEGGMATVYLADDLKHDRRVAIKVLKPELAAVVGAERFLAEIKTTANLQHPHILPLHDSGEAGGFLFYVMPFIEGESLRERLDREKQLPVDESVRIAVGVANALQAAHDQGVIHRDIKPANILLSGGEPLVADFGIALAIGAASGNRLTETGLSVGTPFYMSPEQATGDQPVSATSDVYALACVLYEMLVGEPPYTGPTAQSVMGKILMGEVTRPSEYRKAIPPQVEATLLRALEKLPADRVASAGRFAEALLGRGPVASLDRAPAETPNRRPSQRIGIVVAGLAALVTAYFLGSSTGGSPETDTVRRLNLSLPDSIPMAFIGGANLGVGRRAFEISDDGSTIVYAGERNGVPRLYVRRLDSYEIDELEDTEGAFGPFFSPNGLWIGYFAGNELKKVRVEGGAPLTIATAANAGGADWAEDGTIIYSVTEGAELLQISEDGTHIADLTVDGRLHYFPQRLPGGEALLLSSGFEEPFVLDLAERTVTDLDVRGSEARYVTSGHIVAIQGSVLHAARFDLESLELTSPLVPVLSGVRRDGAWDGHWDITPAGMLVYASGIAVEEGALTWVGPEDATTALDLPVRVRGTFELSPDDSKLATVEEVAGQTRVTVYDLETGRPQRLDQDQLSYGPLAWSPDGSQVVFNRSLPTPIDTPPFIQGVEGGTPRPFLPELGDSLLVVSWASNNLVAIDRPGELAVVDMESGDVTLIPDVDDIAWGLVISPTGDAVAYTSQEGDEYHNYVQPFPPTGERSQVSVTGGAEEPLWSSDGTLLYFRSGRRIMVSSVTTEPELIVGTPEPFYEGDFANVPFRSYEISNDGTRALVIDVGETQTETLNVVSGWVGEIERRIEEAEGG